MSFVAVPIAVADGWWGFLGADDCSGGRAWSAGEIELLRVLAGAIADDVQRQRQVSADEIVGDRYRSIVEHIPAVTYIDALDDAASTLYMSPQVEALLGYAPEEWIGDPDLWLRIVHPDDRARAIAENQRHNETGESFSLDYRMYRKDGRIVWIRDEARIVRDERGVPTFSLGVMIDVTEMKRGDEKVAFLTYHDELTGLPTRAMFEELLELSIGTREASRALRGGDLRRHRRLPPRERLARPARGRRGPERRGRPAPRGDPGDRSGRPPVRRHVPAPARRPRARRGRRRSGRRPCGVGGAADPRLPHRAVPSGRHGALRVRVDRDQPVPAGRRRAGQPPAQRGRGDAGVQEGGPRLRRLQPRCPGLLGEAPVRDPPAQGGGEPAVDAPLPARPRPRDAAACAAWRR